MRPGFLVGFDLGGGGARCLVLDVESGDAVVAQRPVELSRVVGAGGLGCRFDPDEVWKRLCECAREALDRARARPEDVLGLAAAAMRFATVVVDSGGAVLLATPNRDARAAGEALRLAAEQGADLHARTGHWPVPILTGCRLLWLAANEPGTLERAAGALSLSDWVAFRLCGTLATEPSQAGGTLLFDLARRDWAWDTVDALGLPRHVLPPLHASGERIGGLGAAAARDLGLRQGTPVATGGADSQCGLLGAGAIAAGQVGAISGSTTPVQCVTDRPLVDPRLWSGHHVVPGLWILESNAGPMGEALDWLGRLLYPGIGEPVADLFADAARAEPGAAGWLASLGAHVMDARDLGIPMGDLTLSHLSAPDAGTARPQLARSVVEGMACALRANLEQIREVAGAETGPLHLGGGMARSEIWAQMVADVAEIPVRVAATDHVSAFGAALCAGAGAGVFAGVAEAAGALARARCVLHPDAAQAEGYRGRYASWKGLHAAQAPGRVLAALHAIPAVLRARSAPSAPGARSAPGAAASEPGRTAASSPPVRPRLLVTAELDEAALAGLRRLGAVEYAPYRRALRVLAGPGLVEAARDFDVLVTEVDVVDAESLLALPALRVVATCRGDAVNVDVEACTALGIPVLHAPGRNADAVADLTVAFLLALTRRLPEAFAFLREPGGVAGDTARMGQAHAKLRGRELWRQTVGLVGFGAVGRAVARRLQPFGVRLLACDPGLSPDDVVHGGAEPVSLDELLAASDFVSLHAAAPSGAPALLGAAELRRMQRGAFLVNTARAALVDEAALVEALREGHLAGAALDVFAEEPPGPDHPLLALPNVIATPHLGGNTAEVAAHQGEIVGEDLARLVRGERPLHACNPEVLPGFDWAQPRPVVSEAQRRVLLARPVPTVSDLERGGRGAAPRPATPISPLVAPPDTVRAMERVLRGFTAAAALDPDLRSQAEGRDVTLHFALRDLPLSFHLRLRSGSVTAGLGAPEGAAEVELAMPAEVLDGMFTGSVNGMQAALEGRLSFRGDTAKAMALQQLQPDLRRLYERARAEAGGPGDLSALAVQPASAPAELASTDPRVQIVQAVQELYAQQLVTATGGNVSVRIPGTDELWITPSALFKGDLRPEVMVRIDLDGRPLEAGARAPSSESLMHCAVYRARPEAQAVVHAHAPHATVLVNAGLPFLPVSSEAAFFGEIPRIPFVMPGTQALADAVANAMKESWAVLMQNHGLLVAGRSLRRAADMTEIIDRSAQLILGCHAVGREPPVLPPDAVAELRRLGDLVA